MDRLSNVELRTAIRETEKTVGMTVGVANKEAFEHLAMLRMAERNRATALLAAAGFTPDMTNMRSAEVCTICWAPVENCNCHGHIAAAGEKDEDDYDDGVSLAVHNAVMDRLQADFDALKNKLAAAIEGWDACDYEVDATRARLATAEGIIEDLRAQLTAALADNERLRGTVVSRAEYDRRVAEADEWKRRAEAHRAKYDAAVLEIASLKRQLGPLTEEEAMNITPEYALFPVTVIALVNAADRIRARRGE